MKSETEDTARTNAQGSPQAAPDALHGGEVPDASTKEVLLYAFGNIENGIAGQFFTILQGLMVVAMRINPLILGVILGIKTFWDAVTDPVMAQITDNCKSRWGRRRPFILVGGVSRIALLAVLIIWFPKVQNMSSNRVLEGDKQSTELLAEAEKGNESLMEFLAAAAAPGGQLDQSQRTRVDAIRAGTVKLAGMYQKLMPDILVDYGQRQDRLALAEASLATARSNGNENVIITKELNRDYARTIVNNSTLVIDRLDKALALNAANVKLLALLDEAGSGARAPAEALAQAAAIMEPLRKDGAPGDIGAAVRDARQASQNLVVAITLAAKGGTDAMPETEWQSIVTAMTASADAQAVVGRNAQRVQAIISTAEAEVAALEQAVADASGRGTNALFETGMLRGALVAAKERLAGLTDMRTVTQRLEANNAAAAVLDQCHSGRMSLAQAREQTVKVLAGFTGAAASLSKSKGVITEIANAWRIFWDPDNKGTRSVIIYILIGLLLFTTLTTIQSVPYYALGIELCPSYDGRTRVVTYRSVMDHIAGIIGPYVPVFCFMLYFHNALDGLFYVAMFACIIGIPSTILMVMFIKERMAVTISKRQLEHHAGIIMSFVSLCRNPNFLRIVFLYNFLGLVQGMFLALGGYLNIYWVMGSAGAGARIGAYVGTFCWVLGLINLPVLKWACGKFQKHMVMSWAVILMAFGTILNYFCMVKGHPEYQFITPIFFSVGIASYYMVLSTMMADVTDHDELITGFRREGMFGAVNAFIIKAIATVSAVLPGVVLVLSGFDPVLEYNQTEQTIFNMRIMNSFVPGFLTLMCLAVLYKYPLTRERVAEIKEVLRKRRADRAAMEAAEAAAGEAAPA